MSTTIVYLKVLSCFYSLYSSFSAKTASLLTTSMWGVGSHKWYPFRLST